MNNFYAARKCLIKNNGISSTVALIPSKVIVENHFTVESDNCIRDFYQVSYPSIKEQNIEIIDNDIVENIFSNKKACSKYCENINKVLWEPFLSNCDYEKYKYDIETINNELKINNEPSMER